MMRDLTDPNIKFSALHCIGELVEYHSYVIIPYVQHPQLMDVLLSLLSPDNHADNRRINEEALRVLGRLGALDPYQYREITCQNKNGINAASSATDFLSINDMLAGDNKCPDEKFNIRVAVECIRRKFAANDNLTLPLSTFEKIIQAAGTEILPYLGKVMPELHRIVRSNVKESDPPDIVTNVLNSFEKLIKQMRRRILPYMDDIIITMEKQWDTTHTEVRKKLAQLIYHAADVLQYEFKDYMSKVIQLMTRMFEKLKDIQPTHANYDRSSTLKMLVSAIGKFGPIYEYFNLLLKPLGEMLQNPNSDDELKYEILTGKIDKS